MPRLPSLLLRTQSYFTIRGCVWCTLMTTLKRKSKFGYLAMLCQFLILKICQDCQSILFKTHETSAPKLLIIFCFTKRNLSTRCFKKALAVQKTEHSYSQLGKMHILRGRFYFMSPDSGLSVRGGNCIS